MFKLAVFFHCRISGGAHEATRHGPASPPIIREHAVKVVEEQMGQIHESGLADVAESFVVGLNGNLEDFKTLKRLSGAEVVLHGEESAGELNTLALVDWYAKNNPTHHVLYLHSKGVCWPGDPFREVWRRCLMKHLVERWDLCVAALESGNQMAGGHWLSSDQYPQYAVTLGWGIWGGNFFWARGDYLARLQKVQDNRTWADKYDSEMWATSGRPDPVKDFCPHWPNLIRCTEHLKHSCSDGR